MKIGDIKTSTEYRIVNTKTNLYFNRNPFMGECNSLTKNINQGTHQKYNISNDLNEVLKNHLKIIDDQVEIYVRSKGSKSEIYSLILHQYPFVKEQKGNYLKLPLKDFYVDIISITEKRFINRY